MHCEADCPAGLFTFHTGCNFGKTVMRYMEGDLAQMPLSVFRGGCAFKFLKGGVEYGF
jgi:hypothetical protein